MFNTNSVAEYYNTTQIHYEKWWNLKKSLSLHYGIYEKGVTNFNEALVNTNKVLMNLGKITDHEKILDAGCGVGGAAMYLALNKEVEVTGITLSEKQLKFATARAHEKKLESKVNFLLMDYSQTSFENESFDAVWACESISHSTNYNLFIAESYRVLKKGGRLILSDFFLTSENQIDKNNWVKKWIQTWSISELLNTNKFIEKLEKEGYKIRIAEDFTQKIEKSAKRMYYAAFLGAIFSETYNFFNPKVSRFAKHHYRSGYYQYKALKKNLWKYYVIVAYKE